MTDSDPGRPSRVSDRYRPDPNAKIERPELRISGPSGAAIHIDETEDRPHPQLGVLCGTLALTLFAAACSVPLGVVTGLEPTYSVVPLTIAGFLYGRRRFRRQALADPPTRKEALHVLWAFLAISIALVLLCEVGYLAWLKKTSRTVSEKEWTLLSGMTKEDVLRTLGSPTRIETEVFGERWVYEHRFGLLPRWRVVSEIGRDGRFRKSHVDSAKERWAVFLPAPYPPAPHGD